MQRYFVNREQWIDTTIHITGDDAFHLQNVMRAKLGEKVIVCDGTGMEALAAFSEGRV